MKNPDRFAQTSFSSAHWRGRQRATPEKNLAKRSASTASFSITRWRSAFGTYMKLALMTRSFFWPSERSPRLFFSRKTMCFPSLFQDSIPSFSLRFKLSYAFARTLRVAEQSPALFIKLNSPFHRLKDALYFLPASRPNKREAPDFRFWEGFLHSPPDAYQR